jgi:altronate dehydratase
MLISQLQIFVTSRHVSQNPHGKPIVKFNTGQGALYTYLKIPKLKHAYASCVSELYTKSQTVTDSNATRVGDPSTET